MDQDQKEKPGKGKRGTFQEEGESGPTDLGKARDAAASKVMSDSRPTGGFINHCGFQDNKKPKEVKDEK